MEKLFPKCPAKYINLMAAHYSVIQDKYFRAETEELISGLFRILESCSRNSLYKAFLPPVFMECHIYSMYHLKSVSILNTTDMKDH